VGVHHGRESLAGSFCATGVAFQRVRVGVVAGDNSVCDSDKAVHGDFDEKPSRLVQLVVEGVIFEGLQSRSKFPSCDMPFHLAHATVSLLRQLT
jgi:hypothetical protein